MNRIPTLKAMLMREPDMELVGEAIDTLDVLLQVKNTNAEVVAIDLHTMNKAG